MVSVCIATYNGEKYIKEQLDSILCQLEENDEIILSDDHSVDNTINIVKSCKDNRIHIFTNNRKRGVIGNFENAISNSKGDYIFLSDQDDFWLPQKVRISIEKIQQIEKKHPGLPVLIFTDVTVVDSNLNILIDSSWKKTEQDPNLFARPEILCVSNRIMGCTMAFNKFAKQVSLPINENAIMHDWWIALCVAKNGVVEAIRIPTLLYRQHGENVIGSQILNERTFMAKIMNIKQVLLFNRKVFKMVKNFYRISIFRYIYLKIRLHF